uniref:Protein-disulfide isomerase n=1 Tax=Candidatus Kentrum sp. MB TaxID=2138164 RepID=A0A451BFE8_9GAMM|nr:MAG: Protein-disulfide isomerase [Candidatus Kentron sp. MB]VFK34851.1 MAG: Protein-disulfide isomerase [Candidatus Kentron sp. MB]VFK77003.1 MAG: Protein-disulfide isomerase [Candidatus Kentron sp. MB]
MKAFINNVRPFFFGALALLPFILSSFQTLASERALFQLGGLDYQESELPANARLALYELEEGFYGGLEAIFDQVLFDIYLKGESKRLGKSKEEIRAERLSTPAPDEDNIRAFYETIKDRLGKPYEAVREGIVELLEQREMEKKRALLLADYREKNQFKILLPRITPPSIEIHSAGFPVKGSSDAPVTILEFADYQCHHCKTAAKAIARVYQDLKDKVRVIYMDYPINRSGISKLIAQGAACADEQGKFWHYHDLAYQRQEKLNKGSPIRIAKDAGLDIDEFVRCFQSDEAKVKVMRAVNEARRLGLRSTPTIFINGKRLTVFEDFEKDIRQAVEKELASLDTNQ